MSNKKMDERSIIKGSVVSTITNSLNKHGEIKGSNKKETKMLRDACTHHKYNKKGKKKGDISNNGNGQCTCYMCNNTFPTHLFNKDETKANVEPFKKQLNQAKYMAEAAELGHDTINYLVKLSIDTGRFPKVYGKIKHAVERTDNMKKKKKNKNHGNNGGSSNYGAWR